MPRSWAIFKHNLDFEGTVENLARRPELLIVPPDSGAYQGDALVYGRRDAKIGDGYGRKQNRKRKPRGILLLKFWPSGLQTYFHTGTEYYDRLKLIEAAAVTLNGDPLSLAGPVKYHLDIKFRVNLNIDAHNRHQRLLGELEAVQDLNLPRGMKKLYKKLYETSRSAFSILERDAWTHFEMMQFLERHVREEIEKQQYPTSALAESDELSTMPSKDADAS